MKLPESHEAVLDDVTEIRERTKFAFVTSAISSL
jgi:hypothetical protein